MGIAGQYDHELKIDTTTERFILARDETGRAMYQVIEDIPEYQPALRFTQTDWLGGHGQHTFREADRYFEGQSIDTTQPGRVFLGPAITEVNESDGTDLDSAPVTFFWFEAAGVWLCATAGAIYRYDVAGLGKWTAATTTVAGVLQFAEFDGVVYAAVGASTKYYYSTDGDTWTQTDLTDGYANGFIVAPNPSGTAENLWKFKIPNELSRTTDGRTVAAGGAQWESPTYIGDTSNNITNIFLNGDKLYVGKEDGLFWVDSVGGVHAELPDELKVNHSTENFKYVANWQTSTYFSLQRGMGELTTAETYRPVGPLVDIDEISKIGDIKGISADKDWLYVAVDEGTNTHVYKGREVLKQGRLVWEWCPWIFLGTTACSTIRVAQHSTTDRRLWFGYGLNTAYVILSDNPLADSAARYTTSGWLRMSYTYGTDPNWDKLWQSAVIEAHRVDSGAITGAAAGETVEVKYREDTDTTATSIVPAATTVGVYETNFSSALANKRVQFELHLASDTNTATPVVTYFQAKGVEKPTTVRIHEATYVLGDRPTYRVKTLKDLLETGRTSTNLIKFADLRFGQSTSGTTSGSYVWCVMQPGYPRVVELTHEKGRQPELGIMVRLQEVSYTIS
jgi:hypothetical protein